MIKQHLLLIGLLLGLWGCSETEPGADAYGNFEAREIIVSSEGNGKLLSLQVTEGDRLPANTTVGVIDTVQLHLQKEQLLASLGAVRKKTQDPAPDIEVLRRQADNLEREINRVSALVAAKAATPQQLEDLKGKREVVEQQIEAARARSNQRNTGILAEADPIRKQIQLIEEQIRRCYITNPVEGTVLTTYAEAGEFTGMGNPLYKLANLDHLWLRAYVSGQQLSEIRIGQEVEVAIDGEESLQRLPGTIVWIADRAEFTPKIVQTREERVNLVYAIKVRVANDGRLKIGMPGEVHFSPNHPPTDE